MEKTANRSKIGRLLIHVTVLAGMLGCQRACTPSHEEMTAEEVVEAYFDLAFNMVDIEDRDRLMTFTTGDLKAALSQASDETIKEAYLDKNFKVMRYAVVSKREKTPREVELTFQLIYKEWDKNSEESSQVPVITTENTVIVLRENSLWLIHDVMSQETEFDFPKLEENTITPKTASEDSPPEP